VVVGLGRSGIGAAKLLKEEGYPVIVIESGKGIKFQRHAERLIRKGIKVELGKPLELQSFKPWINQLKSVVISPAIPWDHETLNKLRNLEINIQGEMTLAWKRLNHLPWIGITGTNGKTTVTHMLRHIFAENHIQALMGGNVGNSAAEIALDLSTKVEQPEWLIMELSSYQLETAPNISPRIGIWTNLTPDHLERHGTLKAYSKIKRKLLENSQTPIYNADDPYLSINRDSMKNGLWVSTQGCGSSKYPSDFWLDKRGMVIEKGVELFHSSELKVPGKHNIQNLLLATAAAREAGVTGEKIKRSINSFSGVPHRLEKLGHINELSVYNDSKATNFESAETGLSAVAHPALIIAGGQVKEGDPTKWIEQLKQRACAVVLFGSSGNHLKSLVQLSGFKGEVLYCKNLDKAVEIALKIGKEKKAKSLLLSPACASFDQYQDFEERGDHFRKIISPLLTS